VIRDGTVGHKQLSVKTESRKLVADALFGSRRRGLDGPPKGFERGSLVIAQRCEVIVGGSWVCLSWLVSQCGVGWSFLVSSHCIELSGLFVRYLRRTSNEAQNPATARAWFGVT
jgi:hypothetical protein